MKENIYIIRRNWMKGIGFKEHIKAKTTSRNTKEVAEQQHECFV